MDIASFLIGAGVMVFFHFLGNYYTKKKRKSLYELKKLILESSVDIRAGYKKINKLYEAMKEIEKDVGEKK